MFEYILMFLTLCVFGRLIRGERYATIALRSEDRHDWHTRRGLTVVGSSGASS